MDPWSRVRVAKCQMLVTSVFVLLLGLLLATEAALTYFGAHFAVMSRVSPEGSPFEALHRWAFFTGISLAGLLGLGAVLSAAATVREAGRLMAGGFLCFSLVFCALVQVTFWRLRNPTQVEDAILDTYDLAYDRAVRSSPGAGQQELLAIQDTVSMAGAPSPAALGWSASHDSPLSRPGSGAEQGAQDTSHRCSEDKDSVLLPLPWIGCYRNCGVQSGMKGPLSKSDSGWPAADGAAFTGSRSAGRLCLSSPFCPMGTPGFWEPRPPLPVLAVPVLWEELSSQPAGQCGGRPVSRRGGHLTGLLAGHQELPEDTRTHHLHPGQRGPRLHDVRDAAQLLPVVRHLLRPRLGPQRDLCPEPPSPWPPAPGA